MDEWSLEKMDAIIQIAVLGAYADGVMAKEERAVLKECIATHAASEQECRTMFSFVDRIPDRVPRPNSEERNRRIQEALIVLTTAESRERAFQLAVEVADSHQGTGIRESQVLLQLMFDLSIDASYARAVMDETRARRKSARLSENAGVTLQSDQSFSEHPGSEVEADATLRSESGAPSSAAPHTPQNA